MEKQHKLLSVKKQRYGWGTWKPLRTYLCADTNKTYTLWQNWTGPKPPGAIRCPHCQRTARI